MRKLTPQQISPVVRGANYFTMAPLKFGPRINYGFQLFYVFSGSGRGYINDNSFDLQPGVIAVYGPGDVHEFKSYGYTPMTFATIYFSWETIDATRMATVNRSVLRITEEFWCLADPKISILGLPSIPFVFELPAGRRLKIETLFRNTGNSFRESDDLLLNLRHKAALLEIIYELMKFHRDASGRSEHHIIRHFREYIEKHYSEEINRGSISRFLGISGSYLTTLLRKELNTNFTAYLTTIRMHKAMELLQYSKLSVKEIAAAIGFRDYNHFVVRFRQLHGKPPGAMRL